MASLDIFCPDCHNVLKEVNEKIMKVHRNIFFSEMYLITHQYFPKIFHGPHKKFTALPPPIYLMYGP